MHTIENRMGTVEQFILKKAQNKQAGYSNVVTAEVGNITSHLAEAAKIFGEGSFETILARLESSTSQWAIQTRLLITDLNPRLANKIIK